MKKPTAVGLVAVAPGDTEATRFGIVVSKAVGGAVARNRIKRRIRAVCSSWTHSGSWDIVIRVDPQAVTLSASELASELGKVFGSLEWHR